MQEGESKLRLQAKCDEWHRHSSLQDVK